jgi:crotonobetainyl-CoA:carnitine CoA-transferase CaiB-like acyl-CoA transferase
MSLSLEPVTSSELSDVRVIEIGTGISAAFAARILGDFGASVTKVEPPGGDPGRDPRLPGGLGGAMFEYLNWNKASVPLDLSVPVGRCRLRELAGSADVVITSIDPAQARAWQLTPDAIAAWNPRSVIVSVSPFGRDGPDAELAATELILQARGGVMAISGTSVGGPLKRGLRQSTLYGGINAAYTAIAGIYALRASGEGVIADVSLRDCVSAELVMNQSLYAFLGVLQSRPSADADPFGGYPLPCQDGFVTIQASTAAPMSRLAELFGDPALTAAKYASKEGRTAHAAEIRAIIAPVLARVRARDFFAETSKAGYLVGFVQGARDMLQCEHLAARRAFVSFPDLRGRDGQPVQFPAGLGRLSGWGGKRLARRAPRLGEGATPGGEEAVRVPGQLPEVDSRPLSALRVLDLSQVFAGPYLGGILADFGADVVKIESPYRLDQARTDYGGYFENEPGQDPWNRTSTFQVINRGKRAISIDLKNECGRAIFRQMVRHADIVIENFTPRVLPGLGLGYQDLRHLNPSLIMLSNSGFGSTGPWSNFKAQGTTLEATMGISRYTGYRGGPPAKAGQSYPDFIATWTGLTALFAALVGRQRTGRGQWIDLGMYELAISVMPEPLLGVQCHGEDLERMGNSEFDAYASGVIRCAGQEDWLAYSAASPAQARQLHALIAEAGAVGSMTHDALAAATAAWAAGRDAESAAALLQQAGIPAAKVLTAKDLLLDRQLLHRHFYEVLDGFPGLGPRPIIGRPFTWKGGGTDVRARKRAPRFGEDTSEVLAELAGLSAEQTVQAVADGVVALAPVKPLPARANDFAPMVANGSILSVGGAYREVVDEAVRRYADRQFAPKR